LTTAESISFLLEAVLLHIAETRGHQARKTSLSLKMQLQIVKGAGKGKSIVHPRTGHSGPEGE